MLQSKKERERKEGRTEGREKERRKGGRKEKEKGRRGEETEIERNAGSKPRIMY